MAKPLSTTDPAKSGAKIMEMLRASLQERENGKQHDEPKATERLEPETWAESRSLEDSQLMIPPLQEETKAEAPEAKAAVGTSPLQLEALRADNARLRKTIRELEATIEELEQNSPVTAPSSSHGGRDEELLALSDELERERRQLKEDEEAVMQQMRELEIQMSRERAEVARQRNELTRLHNELRHELEMAARDAALRERLAPLQRRHNELTNRRSGDPSRSVGSQQPAQQNADDQQGNGIFRRLFGAK